MSGGGIGRKIPFKQRGRKARMHFANIPAFQRRALGLIDPASVETPVNRAQRRAAAKAHSA